MPPFRNILATCALCLALLGLSSCYSTLHQYAWQRAKVVDDAWFRKEDSELFRVGDKVYAKVYHGAGRGTYEGGFGVLCLESGAASFSPIEGKVKPVYVRLNAFSCAEVLYGDGVARMKRCRLMRLQGHSRSIKVF